MQDRFIWIDLEMSGLDVKHDVILELAVVVTDYDLNVIAEGPVFAIYQSDEVLNGMDRWNKKQHKKSGLIERVRQSTIDVSQAEEKTLTFLAQHVAFKASPICGSSIGQDRRFLDRYMPKLEVYFHYRNLDVSTLKILANCWAPQVAKTVKKNRKHEALSDIYDSIDELRHYREHFLKLAPSTIDEISS